MSQVVIVAEDDPDMSQFLAMRLRKLGLSVMCSPDATHALLGVRRIRPDLIILDVTMPGGNGLAVAEMLSSDPEFHSLPVIIHTGRTDELTRIRCTDPWHYYVQKSPNSWERIKTIVCQVLKIQAELAKVNRLSKPAPVLIGPAHNSWSEERASSTAAVADATTHANECQGTLPS